jgi:cell division protein FtsZ
MFFSNLNIIDFLIAVIILTVSFFIVKHIFYTRKLILNGVRILEDAELDDSRIIIKPLAKAKFEEVFTGMRLISESKTGNSNSDIKVVGIGNSGTNFINYLATKELDYIDLISIDTDLINLEVNKANKRIQIGNDLMNKLHELYDDYTTLNEHMHFFEEYFKNAGLVFIVAGMHDETAIYLAPLISYWTKQIGAIGISLIIQPFEFDEAEKLKLARRAHGSLSKSSNAILTLTNEQLKNIFGKETFANIIDSEHINLYRIIKSLTSNITNRGKVNISYNDLRGFMNSSSYTTISLGYGNGRNKMTDAIESTLKNSIYKLPLTAQSYLLNIVADSNFKIKDLNRLLEHLKIRVGEYNQLLWCVNIDDQFKDEILINLYTANMANEAISKWLESAANDELPIITKIPTIAKELEYYDIPTVKRKNLLENDTVKNIREREEYDLDLDFSAEDLEKEESGKTVVKKGDSKKEGIKKETSKSKAEGPQNEGPQKVGSQKQELQSKNTKKKDKEKPTFIKRQID